VARRSAQGVPVSELAAVVEIPTMIRRGVCLFALWVIAAPLTQADDSSAGVPLPGLRSEPAGSTSAKSSSISLAASKVTVAIGVRTKAATSAALKLIGPQFGWMGESEPYPDRQFPELEVLVDGSPIRPDEHFEAYIGATNITKLILSADMDPWAIAATPPYVSASSADPSAVRRLAQLRAIEKSDSAYVARWVARRMLRIPLEPAADQLVLLKYTARPAYALLRSDQIFTTSREAEYCFTAQQLSGLLGSASASRFFAVAEYAIPSGIDGMPPHAVTLSFAPRADAGASRPVLTVMCAADGSSIAISGNLIDRPSRIDRHGVLHVMTIGDSPTRPQ
jgi:hypothetical protein